MQQLDGKSLLRPFGNPGKVLSRPTEVTTGHQTVIYRGRMVIFEKELIQLKFVSTILLSVEVYSKIMLRFISLISVLRRGGVNLIAFLFLSPH